MARRAGEDVTETELAMLQVLWDRGEATRRQVADVLYPGGGEAHYATVQKLLERLENKGFVRKDRRDGLLIFAASVDREAFIARRLQGLAEALCGGSAASLAMNLVRSQPLSAAEIDELNAVLRERRKGRSGGSK
ncbi:BlaI/MecI/CopY family transcriptional regulator [Aquisphaera insulae]|uniref:BlaI/MecI/CopY family transcriptional regulator n=1 Tax=Aquisphaera insulae TaxID=2712864 RepID=UPI0013EA7AC1|nr:BlaI/MecI/CopY family transcriptional regulator [Aquisphaera insulae]